jgi:hypothetical protein
MGEWMYRSTYSWPRHQFEVSSQLHPQAASPRGVSHRYPLDRRLAGPGNQSGRRGEKKSLAPAGTQTPNTRPFNPYPVAVPTALSRLATMSLSFVSLILALLISSLSVKYEQSCRYRTRSKLGKSHCKLILWHVNQLLGNGLLKRVSEVMTEASIPRQHVHKCFRYNG